MQPVRRSEPYVWVTWITKLLSGEDHCRWKTWFKANYGYTKLPSDFDLSTWAAEHSIMVQERADQFHRMGYFVFVEDQNSFKLRGRNGAVLAGKPDLIAQKDGGVVVVDCKTGKERHSDVMQVLSYMLLLPVARREYSGTRATGEVYYKTSIRELPSNGITDEFRAQLRTLLDACAYDRPPPRVPSERECRFCDISGEYCDERLSGDIHVVETDLF